MVGVKIVYIFNYILFIYFIFIASEEGERRPTESIDYRDSDAYDFGDDLANRTMSEARLEDLDHRDSDDTRDLEINKYAYIRTEAEKVIKCILDQQKKVNTKKNYVNYPESYLTDYAQNNYILSRIGIFRSTATIDKVLSWKSVCIKQPLLKVNSFSIRICTRLFKNILLYSGDIESKLSSDEIVSRTISECLKNDTKIIDELYCQLCKQTYNNCSKYFIIIFIILLEKRIVYVEHGQCFQLSVVLSVQVMN